MASNDVEASLGRVRSSGWSVVARRASEGLREVRFVSQVPRWRWPSPLLPGSRAPHRAASFSSLLGVGVPCDCEIPSRQRPRWLVVPWRVLRRRVVRPVLATVTLGLTPRRLPHPLCASEAPLTFHVSHRPPARRRPSLACHVMMLERPRGPSPWAPAPMARESFRTAASFDVDVDADDRLRRETPVPVRCCGCCFTRAKAERLAEAAISQVEGLDVEVFELTRGTVKRIKRAATGKGGLDAVLKRTLSGVGDGSGLELSRGVLPGTFVPVYVTSGSSHHAILASGSKSLMGLSLYDFGVYADVAQVRDSQLADQYRRKGIGRPPAAMHEDILARGDFGMTVCLGVARTVRASLIQGMYRGIFERRTVKAGGSTDDPGLRQIVDVFSPDKMALVPGAMDGGSVRQGTVVSFTRSRDRERLKVCVNGRHLDTIDSRAVTQALFDMYVGTQPTSEEAQQAAWRALCRIMHRKRGETHHPHSPRSGFNWQAMDPAAGET